MIVRLGFLVAAAVAAYAVEQLNVQTSRSSTGRNKPLGNKFCKLHYSLFFFNFFVDHPTFINTLCIDVAYKVCADGIFYIKGYFLSLSCPF